MLAAMVRKARVLGATIIALAVTAGGSDDGGDDAKASEPSTVTATATATAAATATDVVTTETVSGIELMDACRRVADVLPKNGFYLSAMSVFTRGRHLACTRSRRGHTGSRSVEAHLRCGPVPA